MDWFWVRGWEDYCWLGGNCFLTQDWMIRIFKRAKFNIPWLVGVVDFL